MTTKDQEIKALEKIQKIVADLGEDSYVGTAFEGCFEIAAQNIDWDAACSMKQQRDLAEKKVRELQEVRDALVQDGANLADRVKTAEEHYKAMTGNMTGWMNKANELQAKLTESENKREAAQARVADLEGELIRLKAKLYDMMVAVA